MMLQYNFSGYKTKRLVFENVFSAIDSDSLEQLKELTAKRRLIEESINGTSYITEAIAREMHGGLTSRNQQELQRLEQYLARLYNLIIHVDSNTLRRDMYKWDSELKVLWTSTLTSLPVFKLKGPKFYHIGSLNYEMGMTLFVYGMTLRQYAFEVLPGDLQQCAFLLKKAAGVYSYLSYEVLPPLEQILPLDKPPEATINLSSSMSLFCLAEAQVSDVVSFYSTKCYLKLSFLQYSLAMSF